MVGFQGNRTPLEGEKKEMKWKRRGRGHKEMRRRD
jgi:hypothetical protein